MNVNRNVEDWRHVPSKENISDILTRGSHPSALVPGSIWQEGPAWLKLAQSEWPVTPVSPYKVPDDEICDQLIKYYRKAGQTFVTSTDVKSHNTAGIWFDELVTTGCFKN